MGMDLVALRGASELFDDDLDVDSAEGIDETLDEAAHGSSLEGGTSLDSITDEPAGPAYFHANWTWWSVLLGMLAHLDADLSKASGSNDGDVVDAETAKAWAELVSDALPHLVLVEVSNTDNKYASSTIHIVPATGYDLLELGRVPDAKISMLQDLDDTRQYLEEFVEFLKTCGGFAQY